MSEICPYRPNAEQPMTMAQELLHQGALELGKSPLHASAILEAYRPGFDKAFGLGSRIPGSEQEAYATASTELNLRRMLFRPLIYKSLFITRMTLEEMLLHAQDVRSKGSTSDHELTRMLYKDFSTWDRHFVQDTSEKVVLARSANDGLANIAGMTFNQFSEDERGALSGAFKTQTRKTKAAVGNYLDSKFPQWNGLNDEVLANPDEHNLLPFDLRYWLGKLNMKEDIKQSFSAASRATAGFVTDRLADLHTACYDADMPQEKWWPFSYSKIKLLSIESQLPSNERDEILKTPNHPNPYIVYQNPDVSWDVGFSDQYNHLDRIYNGHLYKGCQGAAEVYSTNIGPKSGFERLHSQVVKMADGERLDVDFTKASSAQLFTLLTVTWGEKLDCRLNTHINTPMPLLRYHSFENKRF